MNLKRKILVVTAVAAEKEAVLNGLEYNNHFEVVDGGVGPIAAAITTTKLLAKYTYDLVISTGIAGGFPDKAEICSLVIADKIVAADLGVETKEGFCSLDELALGNTSIQTEKSLVEVIKQKLLVTEVPFNIGPILTVSSVTGTLKSASQMALRVPGATAEAMEGYGVALAAKDYNLPVLEIRAISNLVGPREREAWRIDEALNLLKTAWKHIAEVLS